MTKHDTAEQNSLRENREQRQPKTIWGHPLAAAAVCLGVGAALALVSILGHGW
jgi:hypothetical protein